MNKTIEVTTMTAAVILICFNAFGDDGPTRELIENDRFRISKVGSLLVLLHSETGQTWRLRHVDGPAENVAWLPIERIDPRICERMARDVYRKSGHVTFKGDAPPTETATTTCSSGTRREADQFTRRATRHCTRRTGNGRSTKTGIRNPMHTRRSYCGRPPVAVYPRARAVSAWNFFV